MTTDKYMTLSLECHIYYNDPIKVFSVAKAIFFFAADFHCNSQQSEKPKAG